MEDINDLIKEIENIEIDIKNNENKTNILIISQHTNLSHFNENEKATQ